MKYKRFEELPVWNDAIGLSLRVFLLTSRSEFRPYRSIRDQIERAAMSISNNVAEGFERGTTQETLTFLYIAKGSCGETRSVLWLCERLLSMKEILPADLRSEISDLRSKSESISRQLRAWCNSLQNSNIRGQRYLTERTKKAEQASRDRDEFLKQLKAINQATLERRRAAQANRSENSV